MLVQSRSEAGRELATSLRSFQSEPIIVLGVTTGGVPVAAEVAHALNRPMDIWVVRKLKASPSSDVTLGAIAEGGAVVLNRPLIDAMRMTPAEIQLLIQRGREDVERRVAIYRKSRPPPSIAGMDAVLVDDGISSGTTARAAIRAIKAQGARRIYFAVPAGNWAALNSLRSEVDGVRCLHPRRDRSQLGIWGRAPDSVPDEEVCQVLEHEASQPSQRKDHT